MNIHYAYRPLSPADDSRYLNRFDLAHARAAKNFHRSFPEYAPTPLWNLSAMAEKAGVASIHLKDESFRFGLDAFKVLGGSYCIARKIGELLDIPAEALSYKLLTSPAIREKTRSLTFVTATDGNHGRGVAWTAQKLGCKSVVYMPKGSSPERLEHIRKAGATASITDMNYDDAVRFANQQAREHGCPANVHDYLVGPAVEDLGCGLADKSSHLLLQPVEHVAAGPLQTQGQTALSCLRHYRGQPDLEVKVVHLGGESVEYFVPAVGHRVEGSLNFDSGSVACRGLPWGNKKVPCFELKGHREKARVQWTRSGEKVTICDRKVNWRRPEKRARRARSQS